MLTKELKLATLLQYIQGGGITTRVPFKLYRLIEKMVSTSMSEPPLPPKIEEYMYDSVYLNMLSDYGFIDIKMIDRNVYVIKLSN